MALYTTVSLSLLLLAGCDESKHMAHGYALRLSEECTSSELKASRLDLHTDGTYDQHHELVNGNVLDVRGQHWSFNRETVKFDSFRLIYKTTIIISDQGTQASLQATISHPQALTFPGSRCVYQGPK